MKTSGGGGGERASGMKNQPALDEDRRKGGKGKIENMQGAGEFNSGDYFENQ